MRKRIKRGVGLPLGLLAVAVGVGMLVAGGATAKPQARQGLVLNPFTIAIKSKPSGRPFFHVPDRDVIPGQEIRVINKTRPRRVGPHTLSLVESDLVPRKPKQIRNCFRKGHICRAIFRWHEQGRKANVDVGVVPGWDTEGNLDTTGDSTLLLKKGQVRSRPAATAATTLHFICAIHPFMHGKVRIAPDG